MASSLSSNTVSATLIIRTSFIWNLNYLDTRKYMTMHTHTEGMANDLLWVWLQVEQRAIGDLQTCLSQNLTHQYIYFLNTAGHDHTV